MTNVLRRSALILLAFTSCGPADVMTPDGGKAGGAGGGLSAGGGSVAGGSAAGGSAAGGSAAGGSAAGGAAAGGSAAGGSAAGGSAAGGSAAGGSAAGGSAAGGSAGGGSAGGGSAQVSFMSQVAPILVARCGTCHPTETVAEANTYVRGSGSCGARISANNATTSILFQKVAGTQTCGGRMPRGCSGNSCLPQVQIDLIRDWINAGAPNN